MKVTVDENKCSYGIEYPCLLEYSGGLVVLFSESNKGIVLIEGNSVWKVGENVEDFGFDGMSGFKLFHGTITLEND